MPTLVRSREDFGPYFRFLADNLGLKDWKISLSDAAPDNPDAHASIFCPEGRKRARIYLSDSYVRDTEDEQRHTAVHELLHCHWSHHDHLIAKWLDSGPYDASLLSLEHAIDGLSDGIAPLMPLPSKILGKLGTKPKPAKKRNS